MLTSVDARCSAGQVVVDLAAHRGMDVQFGELVRVEPAGFAGLIVGGGGTADRPREEGYLVLLPDLAIGVRHYVARVRVDADDSGDLDEDSGLLKGLCVPNRKGSLM